MYASGVDVVSLLPSEPMTARIGSSDIFRSLQGLVSDAIGTNLGGSEVDVCEYLRTWEAHDLRRDTHLMLKIETLLPEILHEFGLQIDCLGSVQFPVNLRILQSEGDFETDKPYGTENVHCDSWSGAPLDSYNLFIYLFVSPGCPYLALYEFSGDLHPWENRYGSYAEVSIGEGDLRPLPFETEVGNGALWPTLTPHRTVIPLSSELTRLPAWRVSLDVRFRSTSPYEPDPNVDFCEFSQSQMTSGGVYWDSSTVGCVSISEKIKRELEVAEKHGSWAADIRREYVNVWYPEVEGS